MQMSTSKPIKPVSEEELLEDGIMGHLTDLRNCVIKALIAIVVIFFVLFPFNEQIYNLFAQPLLSELSDSSNLIATGIIAPFFIPVKVCFLIAFLISLPYVLFQLWSFVAPGLYKREKKIVVPIIVSSTLLFYLGMVFAYFLIFKIVFGFIVSFAPSSISIMPDVQSHLSFAITMFITFGIAFEVPVVVFILVRSGIVDIDKLKKIRAYVIAGAFVIAAIVTPPDVISQFMLAIPVWLLYEIGILFAALFPKAISETTEELS